MNDPSGERDTAPAGDEQAALRQISEIRRLVEASGRFTLLSGVAGLIAGAAAIAGALMSHRILLLAGGLDAVTGVDLFALGEVWLGVLAVASSALLIGTFRRARLEGRALLPRLIMRIGFGLAPSFLVALALTLALVSRGVIDLIAPLWILAYGAAAITAGLFSVKAVQVLGLAFLAMGLVSLLWLTQLPALALGVAFGGFHVLYGLAIWRSHGA